MHTYRPAEEITIGRARAIGEKCETPHNEPVREEVADVRDAYAAELADIQRRMKNQDSTLKNNSGT